MEKKSLWVQAGPDSAGPYSVLFSRCRLEVRAQTLDQAKEMRCPKCAETPLWIRGWPVTLRAFVEKVEGL